MWETRSAFKLGFALLLGLCLSADGLLARSEYQSPCGVKVRLDTSEDGHYSEITPGHCEGLVVGLRNSNYLVLVAVDDGQRTMIPDEGGILSMYWPALPANIETSETIHVKAIARKRKLGYRLDALQPVTKGVFQWDTRQARAFDQDLRFVPLATVKALGEKINVPMQVGTGESGNCYRFEFIAGVGIDSYKYVVKSYPAYEKLVSSETRERYIRNGRPLGLKLCRDRLGEPGLYQLEVTITYSDHGKAKRETVYPVLFLHSPGTPEDE